MRASAWGPVARLAALGVMLAGVSGCVRDPLVADAATTPAGRWEIETEVDRVTGRPLGSATNRGRASEPDQVFQQLALMQLTCFNKRPIVRFSFNHKSGIDRHSELSYRFDEKPGRDVDARFLHEHRSILIEGDAAVSAFVGDMLGSEQLYVRIRSINAGRTTAEFKLLGSEEAVRAGFANCPLPNNAVQLRRSAQATPDAKAGIVRPI